MTTRCHIFPPRALALGGILLSGVALAALGANRTIEPSGSYKPDNVHRAAAMLPADLRRVAILPLAGQSDCFQLGEGRIALDPVLQDELAKTKRFEVVRISPERMRSRTGRTAWSGDEVLPVKFLDTLREESACDAVLFCELTVFRAYAPLAVGWRLRLVDARTQKTLWAADEIFDAVDPAVARGAGRFDRQRTDGWVMLNSPRRFGAYSAATLLATLPRRALENAPKVSLKRADEIGERRQQQTECLPEDEIKAYGN